MVRDLSKDNDLILEVRNLTKQFKVAKNNILTACDNINLSMYKGKTLGIVGESGCGKSTFLRMLMNLEKITSGEIFYKGRDISKFSKDEIWESRQNIQMVYQDPGASFNPRMKVVDILTEPLINYDRLKKEDKEKKAIELLEMVDLPADFIHKYPQNMSGGQKQRIGIARALALNPKFIVCDEPVSALDVSIQAQVLNLMKDLQEKLGLTYMFITHDLSVVKYFSNDIAVMYLGELVEKAPSKDLFKNPIHPYTKALLSAIPTINIRKKMERIKLEGEITSPINPGVGCRFAKRCVYATEICSKESPKLEKVGEAHFFACHRAKELGFVDEK